MKKEYFNISKVRRVNIISNSDSLILKNMQRIINSNGLIVRLRCARYKKSNKELCGGKVIGYNSNLTCQKCGANWSKQNEG